MRLPGEPSVDEILHSIKQVIARDDRAAARQSAVLNDPQSSPAAGDDDVLDLAVSGHLLAAEHEPPAKIAATLEHVPDNASDNAPLMTAESRAAMRESLATLAMMAEPPAHPQIVRSGETSLEQMARELLRPALTDWLDQHLPEMVERLVASEIARIVGKKS